MLSHGWMEIGVLFSTAYARSVRRSPAHMHEDACATQLHCQWCSGRRYATVAANAASVHQCRVPATGTLAVGRRSRSCNQPVGCSLTKDPVEWTPALPVRKVAHCRVPGVLGGGRLSCWNSQGSARTYLRCGRKYYAVLLEISSSSAVKEFWKSVKIWESYCRKFGGFLFWNTV